MTNEELRGLPVVVDLTTAARAVGIGRTTAYEMVRAGRWPTPVLHIGSRIKVPTAPLLDLLGLSTVPPEAAVPGLDKRTSART